MNAKLKKLRGTVAPWCFSVVETARTFCMLQGIGGHLQTATRLSKDKYHNPNREKLEKKSSSLVRFQRHPLGCLVTKKLKENHRYSFQAEKMILKSAAFMFCG